MAEYNSYWRQISQENEASSVYLNNSIHNMLEEQYSNISLKEGTNEQEKAEKLQTYLYEIKNYLNSQTKSIFSAAEKEVLKKSLQSLGDINLDNFLKIQGGSNFQRELVNLNLALINIFSKIPLNENDIKIKTKQIWTGQQLTEAITDIEDSVLDTFKVSTQKYIDKQKKDLGKTRYLQSVQIKIDLITQGVQVTQNIRELPKLLEFFNLYANASFSAKNYNLTKRKRDIQLGSTNLARVYYDFLPTIKGSVFYNNQKAVVPFMLALQNRRLMKNLSNPEADDNNIETHINHIQAIYELQGIGQTLQNQNDPEIKELQQYLNRGVDFLIINDFGSDKITVKSTRYLLSQYIKEKQQNIFKIRKVKNMRRVELKFKNLF